VENRNILIGLGTGLVAGFLLGYGVAVYTTTGPSHQPPPPAAMPAAGGQPMAPQGMGMGQVDAFTRITTTKAVLAANPADVEAWILLGNDYFDTHQPKLAIEAYEKALKLAPKHPHVADILTDQGIMYRELQDYDKALANFRKANEADPTHLQSLLNTGIVYASNLHDKAAARKAWNKIIEMAPESPQGLQAKQFLQGL